MQFLRNIVRKIDSLEKKSKKVLCQLKLQPQLCVFLSVFTEGNQMLL